MFKDVKNPRWTNSVHNQIAFDVQMENEEGNQHVTFPTTANDSTSHGRLLFNLASNGVFGPVADSAEERILRGELPAPKGMKVDGGKLRKMTEPEQLEAGLIERPGHKVVNGEIVAMTLQEQLTAGQIAQAEYDRRISADNTAELERRLAGLQTPVILARVEIDPVFAAERKTKLAALLAVMEQPEWPVKAEWPK